MFSVVVSPPIGSSMPCTRDREDRLDARPFAALDALGLALRDHAQLLRAARVELQDPAETLDATAGLVLDRDLAAGEPIDARILDRQDQHDRTGLNRRHRRREKADVRKAEVNVFTRRD